MENITDEQFMLFKMGNKSVFNIIYSLTYASLEYYAFTLTGNREEAKDIAIISLTKLWDNKEEKIECKEMIRPYLYKVAKNRCKDYLKKSNNNRIRLAALSRQMKIKESDFFRMQEEAEIIKLLTEELNDPDHRSLIVAKLSFLEGEKNPDIAKQVNTSLNNVSQLKRQAIDLLRKRLNLIIFSTVLIILTDDPHLPKKISHLITLFHDYIVLLTR